MFVEAERDTQAAAADLARGSAVLGPPAKPLEGQSPSIQFTGIERVDQQECDLPSCPCGRTGRDPPCNPCPPGGGGDKK